MSVVTVWRGLSLAAPAANTEASASTGTARGQHGDSALHSQPPELRGLAQFNQ